MELDFGKRYQSNKRYIIGVDEAGRGPVAGPVSVGVVLFDAQHYDQLAEIFAKLKDSKKVSRQKREDFFAQASELTQSGLIQSQVTFCHSQDIDNHGISECIWQCVNAGIESVIKKAAVGNRHVHVFLDGKLGAKKIWKQQAVIKGDEKIFAVALASIFAKVERDKLMEEMADDYPEYGFDRHKGYGTKEHLKVVQKLGVCPIHRKSFLKKYI